jgi:hypothetical protein
LRSARLLLAYSLVPDRVYYGETYLFSELVKQVQHSLNCNQILTEAVFERGGWDARVDQAICFDSDAESLQYSAINQELVAAYRLAETTDKNRYSFMQNACTGNHYSFYRQFLYLEWRGDICTQYPGLPVNYDPGFGSAYLNGSGRARITENAYPWPNVWTLDYSSAFLGGVTKCCAVRADWLP